MAQYQVPRSDGNTFFWSSLTSWHEEVEKNFNVPGASRNVNQARAITWLVDAVTIYCTIFQ